MASGAGSGFGSNINLDNDPNQISMFLAHKLAERLKLPITEVTFGTDTMRDSDMNTPGIKVESTRCAFMIHLTEFWGMMIHIIYTIENDLCIVTCPLYKACPVTIPISETIVSDDKTFFSSIENYDQIITDVVIEYRNLLNKIIRNNLTHDDPRVYPSSSFRTPLGVVWW